MDPALSIQSNERPSSSHVVHVDSTDGINGASTLNPLARSFFPRQHLTIEQIVEKVVDAIQTATRQSLENHSAGIQTAPPPPSTPQPPPPQITIQQIAEAIKIAVRQMEQEAEKHNTKFALFASFMLMILTGSFVLSFEQAQKWNEELIKKEQQADASKSKQNTITLEMGLALLFFFIGLLSAMTLMVTGTFSYIDMRRFRGIFYFCAWFLVISTLTSSSLPVIGIIGVKVWTIVYAIVIAFFGVLATLPLIENYRRA